MNICVSWDYTLIKNILMNIVFHVWQVCLDVTKFQLAPFKPGETEWGGGGGGRRTLAVVVGVLLLLVVGAQDLLLGLLWRGFWLRLGQSSGVSRLPVGHTGIRAVTQSPGRGLEWRLAGTRKGRGTAWSTADFVKTWSTKKQYGRGLIHRFKCLPTRFRFWKGNSAPTFKYHNPSLSCVVILCTDISWTIAGAQSSWWNPIPKYSGFNSYFYLNSWAST